MKVSFEKESPLGTVDTDYLCCVLVRIWTTTDTIRQTHNQPLYKPSFPVTYQQLTKYVKPFETFIYTGKKRTKVFLSKMLVSETGTPSFTLVDL